MPRLNNWSFQAARSREQRPLHNSMDGTRVVRAIELYEDEILLGEAFHPDYRQYPSLVEVPRANSWEQIQQYVFSVRVEGKYAEAFSCDLVDTTGKLPDLMVDSIPEATSEVTMLTSTH